MTPHVKNIHPLAGPVGAPAEVVAATLSRAAHAEEQGAHEAAFNMLSDLPVSVRDTDDVACHRARLLVLTGRAQDALAVLGSRGITTLPVVLEFPDAVLAAALAATGNREAYRRMLGFSGGSPEEVRQLTALRAVSAEACGDTKTADRSWIALVHRFNDRSPRALGRFTAAQVAMRDADRPTPASSTVLMAAANFDGLDLAADPRPALEAAAVLEWRTDMGGARLLLDAVRQRHPHNVALTTALRRLVPSDDMGLYRVRLAAYMLLVGAVMVGWSVGVALAGAPALAVFSWLIAFLGCRWWSRTVMVPGLTRTDSVGWRSVRGLRFVSRTGEARSKDQRGWFGLVGLAGMIAGEVAGVAAAERVFGADVPPTDPNFGAFAGLAALFAYATAIAGYLLARRVRRLRIVLRLGRHRRR
jgi:hypothetical protein